MKLNEVHRSKRIGATVIAPDGLPALVWCEAPLRRDSWGGYVTRPGVWLWRDGQIVTFGRGGCHSIALCSELSVVSLHDAYTMPRKGRRFDQSS